MATFIPNNIDAIENVTERYMAQIMAATLEHDDIYIIHGLQTAQKTSTGIILGEADFILISEEYGLLLIEVKGGDIYYNPNNQQWGYNPGATTPLVSRDPFEQCRNNLSTILNVIKKKIPNFSQTYAYGYAIALPDSSFQGEQLPTSITSAMLFNSAKCQPDTIRTAIFDLFKELRQKKNRDTKIINRLTKHDIELIFHALTPVYHLTPIRYKIFEEYEKRIHALTEDQNDILDTLKNQNKAAIAGVAGSGKTFLATAKAQSEAQKGKRVLFLCYNKALAEWLNSTVETGEIENGYLHIDNYHHFVAQLCRDYERDWPGSSDTLWNEYAPNQLYDIAANYMSGQDKFDTIIVDEGQDFHPNWWASLTPLFRVSADEQCYYVVDDPNQNIYQGQVVLPAGLTRPFPLRLNCRNTKCISDYCAQLLNIDMRTKKFAPEGIDPEFHHVMSLNNALTHAQQLAATMIAEEQRLNMSQVAILCIGVPSNMMNAVASRQGFTKDHTQWRTNAGVLVCDAGAFKGLESDLIIVIDNGGNETPELKSKRYVAFSRAKFELHVVTLN